MNKLIYVYSGLKTKLDAKEPPRKTCLKQVRNHRADPFSTVVSRNVAGAPLLVVQVRVTFADIITGLKSAFNDFIIKISRCF